MLSGFVICYSADGSTAAAFARSRLVRLMPAIWLCGTATALAFIIIAGDRAAGLAWRYLNTLVLWPIGPWIDGSYWTLPIEVAFYALVWLTLLHRRAPRLETVLTALALISAAGIGLSGWGSSSSRSRARSGPSCHYFPTTPVPDC